MSFKNVVDQSGLSRYEIAKRSGVDPMTIQKLYTGKSSVERLGLINGVKLSKALGFKTVNEFFSSCLALNWNQLLSADGWTDLSDDLSVFVEDGKVIKATKGKELNMKPAMPYVYCENNTWARSDGISVKEFIEAVKSGNGMIA